MKKQIEWKPIPSLNETFAASNLGKIKRLKGGKRWNTKAGYLPKLQQREDGYVQVSAGGKLRLVHILVCEAFNGPKPEGHQCNHKDGNRANNIPTNLEWVTSTQNNLHRHRILKCHTNARSYRVTSPDGNERIVENLYQFCIKNKLTNSNMAAVLSGRQSHHKGWKVAYA